MNRSKTTTGKYNGCLLKNMEGDSDSDVPEFALPPKSIVKRPRKSIKKRSRSKWRKYYRLCCRYCSTAVLVLVLTACLLSIILLFWFSLRLYRDVGNLSRRLTIEINKVQAEQAENVEKCNTLKLSVDDGVNKNQIRQQTINTLKQQVASSALKINSMNDTMVNILKELHNADNKVMLKNKVNALQKGMADSGAEMTKLSDQLKQVEKQTSLQSSLIALIHSGLWNISQSLANTTSQSKLLYDGSKVNLRPLIDSNEDGDGVDLKEKPFTLHQTSSDVVRLVKEINQTLSFEILQLQSKIPLLINSRLRNLTQLFNTETVQQITVNTNEITLLWGELVKHNYTLWDIRQRIGTYKTDRPRDLLEIGETMDPTDNSETPKSNTFGTLSEHNSDTRSEVPRYNYPNRRSKQHNLGTYPDAMDDDK